MQTFITDFDMRKNASNLDNKRLGKQRVEALQIADIILNNKSAWSNHPAVKMWRGYEAYLLTDYTSSIMGEWNDRGFKNEKCYKRFRDLMVLIEDSEIIKPIWITKKFITAHRSNLIRKNDEHYRKLWPDTPNNLSYIWPVK